MEIGATGGTATLQNNQAQAAEGRQQVRRDVQQQTAEEGVALRESAPTPPTPNERIGSVINTRV